MQRKLESINLGATNGNFVTKGEIEKKLFNHTYWLAQIESLCQHHIETNSDSVWALKKVYL